MEKRFISLLVALTACQSTPPSEGVENAAKTSSATAGMAAPNASAGSSGQTNPATMTMRTLPGVGGAGASAAGVASNTAGAAGSTTSAVAASAGTGAATATAPAMTRDIGNYFESGAWHGYVFATAQGTGSSISPMDFSAQTTGMPRCVKGAVGASMDYSSIAQLGFELSDSGSSVTPTKAGVSINVVNNANSPLRFQVESPDATKRWCAVLSGSGGFVPWASLNTACWNNSGDAYKNEPIAKAMVLVPGTMSEVKFDFCIQSLAEADAPASSGAAGAAGSTSPANTGAAGSASMNTGNGTVSGQGMCDGYATGYWDCCKPHCGWQGNVPSGSKPIAACDKSDNPLGGNYDAKNACEAGGTAYQCHNLVPWAVNDKLAYGYAAVGANADKDICGKCYQLDFVGKSFNAGEDPGSTALAGKTLIVQAINIGSDVQNGQFDVLIPGRGVGMFDACSSQWGVSKSDLGEQYGGFLPVCKAQNGHTNHAALKSCVAQSCMNVFEAHGLTELAAGCQWFVDWFAVADNPSAKYKQVPCPAELANKGMQRDAAPSNACLR